MGRDEGFAQVEPTLIIDGGAEFGVNLGAPVRLRLWGGEAGGGRVRREDWDSLSDWGQLVRGLKLGADTAPLGVWLGGTGELQPPVRAPGAPLLQPRQPGLPPGWRLSSPARGPLYMEAFASDVLGARLLGAEPSLDVEHVLFGQTGAARRYTLALSAVHDWGRAEGRAPGTLAHLDGIGGGGGASRL